jgi:hypothetical protein
MLGNGLRVVTAWARLFIVETRGVRLTLRVDEVTGHTDIVRQEAISLAPGLTIRLPLSDDPDDAGIANLTLALARYGSVYDGPSLPHWYGRQDLARLFQAAPGDATAADVIRDLGLAPPARLAGRLAREIDQDEVGPLLREMQQQTKPLQPEKIGRLGPVYRDCQGYAHKAGLVIEQAGGHVPYVFEATVQCERSEKKGVGQVTYTLTLNRSATLAHLQGASFSDYLSIKGCGLDLTVSAPAGNYTVNLSVITPHIQLTSDGKSPSLAAYEDVIADVVQKAARQAHRAVAKPETATTIKAAAWQVMPKAYFEASSGQTLPANARQIMYAARGEILRITGKKSLDDHYFTQALLPDYIQAHPKETADWDVVFDDRGSFTEPHTGRVVPLGTVEVRKYIGERPTSEKPASVSVGLMFPTVGPLNRYRDILFIEKEGFSALIAQVGLAERFDIAVMSTKGMSVTAARLLIDKLMQSGVERVFTLHDFDCSGFSIFGTLGMSNRRYRFQNEARVIDIGLRLTDIQTMGLEWEPYSPGGDWTKRAATLAVHGATHEEIRRLRTERVELNAMSSGVFVQFIERKLIAYGVRKMVPKDDRVLQQHARQVILGTLLNQSLDAVRPQTEAEAGCVTLPSDLRQQVESALKRQPGIPWDLAVTEIARQVLVRLGLIRAAKEGGA